MTFHLIFCTTISNIFTSSKEIIKTILKIYLVDSTFTVYIYYSINNGITFITQNYVQHSNRLKIFLGRFQNDCHPGLTVFAVTTWSFITAPVSGRFIQVTGIATLGSVRVFKLIGDCCGGKHYWNAVSGVVNLIFVMEI